MEIIALPVAASLMVLALLHAYWGTGGLWPGSSRDTLAAQVFGGPPGTPMPSVTACYAVAGLLILASWLVLAASGLLSAAGWPTGLIRSGAFGVAGVFVLRGGLGYALPRLTSGNPTFARLNRAIYSPLCLGLGALTLLSLLG
ncbi:DUF3995 domain-containing protein [Deinococcus marmoris]|uniref:DUF3995 domain-containing protein n=1 Tax=Deinococcus marmoris TaxID=249408 RepID=UPI000495046E|nr:DUF3995 domain-containing protein [Deinococcus marmoris]